MAQQPIPTIGSISLFIHLTIIIANLLIKFKKIVYYFFLCILVFTAVAILFLLYNNNTSNKQYVNPVISNKITDEKTEPINDTTFTKNQHYAAWIPWWDEARVLTSLKNLSKGELDSISPVWYTLSADGKLSDIQGLNLKNDILAVASSSGISVIPTINNEAENGFDGDRVSILLNNKNLQSVFITKAISLAIDNKYIGWDIDWEQKNINDKKAFSDFILYVSQEFHKNNLKLIVTVQAKTDETNNNDTNSTEDWKALSKAADQIRIMAYDFHYDQSDAGAITPLSDLEQVLDYAVTTMLKDKIVIGVPLYGYDWDNKNGESVQYEDAMDRINKNSGTVTRDSESEELTGQYGTLINPHTLWFLDQKSVLRILYIADNYGISNISFWRLGGEDSALWTIIKNSRD
jgi:spore germination protein